MNIMDTSPRVQGVCGEPIAKNVPISNSVEEDVHIMHWQ